MKIDPATLYSSDSAHNITDDFERYEDIFAKNDMPRAENFLPWRYEKNPAAQLSNLNFAIEKETGEVGAVYAAMGATFRYNGNVIGGTQSLDTLTDASHRRRGLFPFLTEANYEASSKKGAKFVYGFPNQNSYPIFSKHLKWDIYGPVDFMFRPLRTGYFLERVFDKIKLGNIGRRINFGLHLGSYDSQQDVAIVHQFDNDHSAIWEDAAKEIVIGVERSCDYLNWRIFGRPDADKYHVREISENGQKVGFVIWCVENKHGGKIGYLMECLCSRNRPDLKTRLLKIANKEMYDAGADLVLAWIPPHVPGAESYSKTGYFKLPSSLRFTQLYWGARQFHDGPKLSKDDWYISYLDSDTV